MKKLFILISALGLALSGCERMGSDEAYSTMTVPQEKVHRIEPLNLEQYEAKEQPTIPSALELPEKPLERLDMTLEQCRALALENNLDLKVQLLSPKIAQENINAERAKFEASFYTNLNYYKIDQPAATQLTIEGSKAETSQINMGVEIPFKTGGKISFDMSDSRNKSNFASSVFNPSYSNDFSVSISQPLLRNAGVKTNTHSIRIVKYNKSITDSRTKLEVIRVIAATDRVFWRLYAAYKQLEVQKQLYELSDAQLQRAKRFVKNGQHSQIEIHRAQAGLAKSLESIIIAENNLRDRQRELKQILNKAGLNLQGITAIIPSTEPNPIHYTFNAEDLVNKAIENRMEMLELELEIAKNISNIDYLRNQALPIVNMNYTYNVNGLGDARSDSLDLLQDHDFIDHRIGLSLIVPLGNNAAKSNLRAAYYTRTQTLASKENREKMIEVEVLDALDQLESNWQRILAARQSTILQERLYQAEIRQFENELRTSTDVLEAQTNFTNAQSSEINALTEFQIALVDLAYATGTLLGAAQVDWQPDSPIIQLP